MANHSATKKAIRKTVSKTAINKNRKSRIRTYVKRVVSAVADGSSVEANNALIEAQSEIMRGVASNLIKKNTGARKVSRLSRMVKEISTAGDNIKAATDRGAVKPAKATTKAAAPKATAKVAPAKKAAAPKAGATKKTAAKAE